MPTMQTYVAIDTPTLTRLNDEARTSKFNRRLSDAFMRTVDPDGKHVVAFNFLTEEDGWDIVRCTLLVAVRDQDPPAHATLDIELNEYLKLPRYGINGIDESDDEFAPIYTRRGTRLFHRRR